jgi:hypothetical protein
MVGCSGRRMAWCRGAMHAAPVGGAILSPRDGYRGKSSACHRERRLVTQIFTSWNPLFGWLRQLEALMRAA